MTVTFGGFAVVAGVLLMAGTGLAQDAKAEKGLKVFVAQKCTTCHSIAGTGNKKGSLDEVGSKLTAAQIREWIVDPDAMRARSQPPSTRKPPMKKKVLSDGDVAALVGLLTGLKKP